MSDNAQDIWLTRRQRLVCLAAAAVTSFYLHCFCIIMAKASTTSSSSQWSIEETEALLQYLLDHKSEMGEAGNFKKKTYVAAAEIIPNKTKSWDKVKSKWGSVSST